MQNMNYRMRRKRQDKIKRFRRRRKCMNSIILGGAALLFFGGMLGIILHVCSHISRAELRNAEETVQTIPMIEKIEENIERISSGTHEINADCESYRPTVQKMARRYGMTEYVDLIMAVMMQESAGHLTDVMQSSEGGYNTRYPNEPDAITDPEYSIECGVQELKEALEKAGSTGPEDLVHIRQALQAYNFGIRYLEFAEKKGVDDWEEETVAAFAEMASNGTTRDKRAADVMGKWDYGDQKYPEHVLRYYHVAEDDE